MSPRTSQRPWIGGLIAFLWIGVLGGAVQAAEADNHFTFKRVRTQFIAALGDPLANSGSGAQTWGVWRQDPGPRGVWLKHFAHLKAAGGHGPNWQFDATDWWLDENGLLMEKPDFPLPPGHYLVTGDREVTTVLTVHESDDDGQRKWELKNGATLHDVTHMPCRSARYTPLDPANNTCSPANASLSDFKVKPGSAMPDVPGCRRQDYAVLFIIGIAVNQ